MPDRRLLRQHPTHRGAAMPVTRLLTTGQAAAYCGVSFRTVIRWIQRGQLRGHQLPGRGDRRVAVKDLVAFLVAHDMPVPAGLRDRKRVLVVDDDPAMAHAIQRVLNGSGFETRTAGDGFRAGALLATFGPAVMTLDLRMPGIGGMEVLEFLRKSPELADIKVLVISALPREHLQDALAAGAHDALEKPFDNGVLVDTVSRLAREPD